jgi:transposase
MSQALNEFATYHNVSSTNRIVLLVDRAGFHTGGEVKIPEGIHIEYLPSHTPELQPVERLWDLSDEPVVNKCFTSISELENVLYDRCRALSTMKDIVREECLFHWWLKTVM